MGKPALRGGSSSIRTLDVTGNHNGTDSTRDEAENKMTGGIKMARDQQKTKGWNEDETGSGK